MLQRVQEAAAANGLLFALSLAAEGSCTIGGNLATNAGGTQVLRYGNARELCLGIEVVTADGRVWDGLIGLRKDNTGYDLRDLLIGSEGTLGDHHRRHAEARIRARPRVTTALAALPTLAAAIALLALARGRSARGSTGFEVMNRLSLEPRAQPLSAAAQPLPPAPWTVLLEHVRHRDEAHAPPCSSRCSAARWSAAWSTTRPSRAAIEQANAMWHVRESIPLAQSDEGANIKHDIALPVSAIAAFVAATDAALVAAFPGVRLVDFGHLGDGNLHYNVQAPVGRCLGGVRRAIRDARSMRIVYDAVVALGGSISAEHGIGALKRDELAARKSPVALAHDARDQAARSIRPAC